ncbi:related to G1/S-specific cyclin pas1 [Cephalotrichum gorgonifer]|uniref:Related to G1/S-specific cyclin pas1 n=1 Tax=Cephalotrichum gorgonifer TaxID=2041049 RepID=A0AAE8MVX3_9PEZI|nr:related to G1/S-specific cyclin pas1 [Cephalotrichum gorgonifer]
MRGSLNNGSPPNPTSWRSQYAPFVSTSQQSSSASSVAGWSSSLSSQSSVDSLTSSLSLGSSSSCDSVCSDKACLPAETISKQQRCNTEVIPAELRHNPRRTSSARTGCPPKLVHQQDRKVNFVDSLVAIAMAPLPSQCLNLSPSADSAALLVEAIWPLSSVVCRNEISNKAVLPLRTFIQETLKRSRTSYSTLQVTMYYLILIKPHVPRHGFTMEQPSDDPSSRALQCGRRVFLAALILASKYLQDRNYSARAWSKISGLHTQEINQNETAFLHAVNWNLHITSRVWKRWTRILLDHRPPSAPPSPGGLSMMPFNQQIAEWKRAMFQLDPELANTDALRNLALLSPVLREPSPIFPFEAQEATPVPPVIMEPSPVTMNAPGPQLPALGLLPTPRLLTPQSSGFSTPAASTAPQFARRSSMGMAMSQASNLSASQVLDCWPSSNPTPSPQIQIPARRLSLSAYSIASSPESMVSDISRTSRSSSISSSTSLASATTTARSAVPSRLRIAKSNSDRPSVRPGMASSVPEEYEQFLTASPESYSAPIDKPTGYLETPLGQRESELEAMVGSQWVGSSVVRTGSKRGRSDSVEASLHDNVRDILSGSDGLVQWRDALVQPKAGVPAVPLLTRRSSKRLCCSTEVSQELRGDYMTGLTPPIPGSKI